MLACHHCDYRPCVRPDHLYAGTYADNARDAAARSAPRGDLWHEIDRHPPRGINHHRAKLAEADIIQIRDLAATGLQYTAIAEKFGISSNVAEKIAKRTAWAHIAGGAPPPAPRPCGGGARRTFLSELSAEDQLRLITEYETTDVDTLSTRYGTTSRTLRHALRSIGVALRTQGTNLASQRGKPKRKKAGAVLNEAQVLEVRRRLRVGERPFQIAAAMGIKQSHISGIRSGRLWPHLHTSEDFHVATVNPAPKVDPLIAAHGDEIRCLYPTTTVGVLAERFAVSESVVYSALRKMGVAMRAQGELVGRHAKPNARLTPDGVRTIRARLASGDCQRTIARDYNLCPSTITAIKQRRVWGDVP